MKARWMTVAITTLLVVVAFAVYFANRTTSTTSTSSSTSSVATSTSTTVLDAATKTAIWPTAASTVRYSTPEAAAIGFAVDFVHMTSPVAEPFRRGDARSGEVPIRATAVGPMTTVLVRQLTSDNSWWVLGASSPDLTISHPSALALVHSPLAINGSSTAFEAVVNVALRQDNITQALIATTFKGGSMGQMGPFQKTLTFSSPTSAAGALVLYTISAKDGSVANASVMRVMFR